MARRWIAALVVVVALPGVPRAAADDAPAVAGDPTVAEAPPSSEAPPSTAPVADEPVADEPVAVGLATDVAAEVLEATPTLDANPFGVLVTYRAGTGEDAKAAARARVGAAVATSYDLGAATDTELLELYGVEPEAAVAALRGDPAVAAAELDEVVAVSGEPLAGEQWALGASPGINAATAWSRTKGSSSVVVAVIDDGLDLAHPDLAGNVWTNTDEVPGNGVDDDHNGYVDDVHGWDFADGDNDPRPTSSHGTHIAGVIAARHNGVGIAGVAPGVRIMPLRFIGASGVGYTSRALEALEYAVANGARISNNSWGGGSPSTALYEAIAAAGQAGHLFVAAAGNGGADTDGVPLYPASYDLANIVSVAAVASDGSLPSWSNRGRVSVDVAAPGVTVVGPSNGGGWITMSGTSMATPHVAAVAALLLSAVPTLTVATLRSALLSTARPLPSLTGRVASGGVVDAGAALAAVAPLTPPMQVLASASLTPRNPVRVLDTRTGLGAPAARLVPGATLELALGGKGRPLGNAVGAVINVVAVDPGAPGYVTVWPCGRARPGTSTVNFQAGETSANGAHVALGRDGRLCILSIAPTDVVIDVSGSYAPTGSGLAPLTPARVLDTRAGGAPPVPGGQVVKVTLAGRAGVPKGATAVALNLTVVEPVAPGYATIWPCGPVPLASSLNFVAGDIRANGVTVPLSKAGEVCLVSNTAAHWVLDVTAVAAAGRTTSLGVPARAADTRLVAARVTPAAARSVPLRGVLPAGATTVLANITVTEPLGPGFVTAWPCDRARPLASVLNFTGGMTRANNVAVSVGSSTSLCLWSSAPAHLVVDVTGSA